MVDREKVIKGLECLMRKHEPTANPCKDCGYINRENFGVCVKDVASDAWELLKEQEAVKPFHKCIDKNFTLIEDSHFDYCPYCGKPITWSKLEGR